MLKMMKATGKATRETLSTIRAFSKLLKLFMKAAIWLISSSNCSICQQRSEMRISCKCNVHLMVIIFLQIQQSEFRSCPSQTAFHSPGSDSQTFILN